MCCRVLISGLIKLGLFVRPKVVCFGWLGREWHAGDCNRFFVLIPVFLKCSNISIHSNESNYLIVIY